MTPKLLLNMYECNTEKSFSIFLVQNWALSSSLQTFPLALGGHQLPGSYCPSAGGQRSPGTWCNASGPL